MTTDSSTPQLRPCLKWPGLNCDRTCVLSVLKHSCWSAIILGAIMLGLGIVLRSSLISNSTTTVTSSGLLFILIGIFIIIMGPFAAIYDLIIRRKSVARRETSAESGLRSPRPSQANGPPSYDTVMKTPSAIYTMRFSELSAKELSSSEEVPPPPSYEEVAENCTLSPNSEQNDTRRMTAP